MKLKVCSIFTTILLVFSQGMTASAAAIPAPMATPPDPQTYSARSTVNLGTVWGDSYNISREGVQCRCSISGQTVTAGTDKSNSTVTISSKSYNNINATGTNGSNGGSAANTVTVTYTATSSIQYTYQEHGAPYSTTIQILLRRY